jgi:hypothetical protein
MPRWAKRSLLAVGVLALLAGAGVLYVITSDTTTPVDVEDAVDVYREEHSSAEATTTTSPEQRRLPAPGVYVYATEGSEGIDILGGATHHYPAETTLTIDHVACGVRQRWTPIEERSDDEELCVTDDGLARNTLHTHHEFFNLADDQDFVCEPGYVVIPAEPSPGDTWSTRCDADAATLIGTGEVVGDETLDVAGTDVDTVHVRVEETSTGSSDGTSSDDYWFRTSDGLLVARESSVQTRSDSPVGTATYTERFSLHLTSLEPRT